MMPTMVRTPSLRIVRLHEGATLNERIDAAYDAHYQAERRLCDDLGLTPWSSWRVYDKLLKVRNRWLDAVCSEHNRVKGRKANRIPCGTQSSSA